MRPMGYNRNPDSPGHYGDLQAVLDRLTHLGTREAGSNSCFEESGLQVVLQVITPGAAWTRAIMSHSHRHVSEML